MEDDRQATNVMTKVELKKQLLIRLLPAREDEGDAACYVANYCNRKITSSVPHVVPGHDCRLSSGGRAGGPGAEVKVHSDSAGRLHEHYFVGGVPD
jgi:hypothetical protein